MNEGWKDSKKKKKLFHGLPLHTPPFKTFKVENMNYGGFQNYHVYQQGYTEELTYHILSLRCQNTR